CGDRGRGPAARCPGDPHRGRLPRRDRGGRRAAHAQGLLPRRPGLPAADGGRLMSTTTTATDLEDVVHAFDAKWRAGGPAAAFVERWRDLLDPEIRLVQPQVSTLVGFEAFARGFVEPFFALMPDA